MTNINFIQQRYFTILMTRPEGFEPSTSGFGNLRSTT